MDYREDGEDNYMEGEDIQVIQDAQGNFIHEDHEEYDNDNLGYNRGSYGGDDYEDEMNENKELIYNEDSGFHNGDKLFDEESQESAVYEIEFKIFDKNQKNLRYVKVELEKLNYHKPYLGGFVNKTNGSYYYHAYAQTDQYKNKHITKEEREVQTYQYVTRSTKMHREFGTQMEAIGLYIDPRQDKVLIPTKYFDSDEWFSKRLTVVLFLQKMMRGFFARKTKRLYKEQEQKKREEKERAEEEERQKEEIKNKREIERRMHPKSKEDFMLLKKELEQWVHNETIRIKASTLSEEDKTLALQELLHKEISLLQTIEKLKISANKENKTEKIEKFLAKMSADKEWVRHDGHPIEVETPLTKTAEKLEEQFKNLNSSTSVDIRLKNLLEFKKLMEGYYEENRCVLIQEIIALIERESDMLQRGRPDSSLEGLRQRLNNLYLSFIEVPKFNPEAGRFQIIPKNYLKNLYKVKKSDGEY